MPIATYDLIESQTVSGSAASSITFSNIPQTYTDLILFTMESQSGHSGGARSSDLRFNGDTNSNYIVTEVTGGASATRSTDIGARGGIYYCYYTYSSVNSFNHSARIDILSYTNTNFYKTILVRAGNDAGEVGGSVATWKSTAAITSIELKMENLSNFNIGSTFTLYGVK